MRKLLLIISLFTLTVTQSTSEQHYTKGNTPERIISTLTEKEIEKHEHDSVIQENFISTKAEIKLINGSPKLLINNIPSVPFLSFVNSDAEHPKSKEINGRQILYAGKYGGVHLHQANASVWKEGDAWNFSRLDEALNRVVNNDSAGYIILRIDLSRECLTEYYQKDDIVRYADGTYGEQVSIASEKWKNNALETLKSTIDYIQSNSEYAPKVIGYNFTAGGGREWFQYNFVDSGLDVSEVNISKFKEWLKEKYGAIPKIDGLYDKLGSGWIDGTDNVLYTSEDDSVVLDYLDYYNEMVAETIEEFASLIKTATQRRAIVGIYYGYQLELPDAKYGHFALNEILSNYDIDFIASPVCYLNRNEGGIGAEMTLIDAIHSRGKMYFYECDFRSPHNSLDNYIGEGINKSISTHENLIEVFRRQLGYQMLKGAGGWTYDLAGRGWYDNKDFWREIRNLTNLYEAYDGIRPAPSPEVVLIIDEEGLKHAADPWKINKHMLNSFRDELYKSSVNFGIYTLSDLVEGRVPESTKLYFMIGAFNIKSVMADRLSEKLQQKDKTVVWFWDFGQTPKGTIKQLTGLDVDRSLVSLLPNIGLTNMGKKTLKIKGELMLPVEKEVAMSYVISDGSEINIFGTTNDFNTFVEKQINGSNQIFYGTYSIKANLIKSLAQYSGAHVFSLLEDPMLSNSNMIVFHTAQKGTKELFFPQKTDVYDYYAKKWYNQITTLKFDVDFSETKLFFYGDKEEINQIF